MEYIYGRENTRWSVHVYKKSWKIGKSKKLHKWEYLSNWRLQKKQILQYMSWSKSPNSIVISKKTFAGNTMVMFIYISIFSAEPLRCFTHRDLGKEINERKFSNTSSEQKFIWQGLTKSSMTVWYLLFKKENDMNIHKK